MTDDPRVKVLETERAPIYWPDLRQLPSGWKLFRIEWSCGRSLVELHKGNSMVRSSGQHRTPSSAFTQACERAISNDR